MGLSGTHSWHASSTASSVQRYVSNNPQSGTFYHNGVYHFLFTWWDGDIGWGITWNAVRFTIKTDGAGAQNLSFSCPGGRSGGQNMWWKVSTSSALSTSGGTACSYSNNTWSGSLSNQKLLPNTTYYVFIWSGTSGNHTGANLSDGTLTINASGTYGSPGEITANNTTFDNPISMSFGSSTSGGKYTVSVKVGSSTAVTLQTQGSASSLSWTPSLATYGASYPNKASVSCVITVSTYFGGVLSGTKTKTVTISFTAAQVGPSTANAFSIAPYNTGQIAGMTGYIQGYSKIRASFVSGNVTLQYGATVSKWTVKFGGAAAVDVAAGTASQDSGVISAVTTVVCTVTDSRGFTASETYETTITPYGNPALSATVTRTDANGNEADDGTYLRVDMAGWYSNIEGQNTQTSVVRKKLASASTFDADVTITGGTTTLSGDRKLYSVASFLVSGMTDAVYDIQVEITDGLGNTAVISAVIQSNHWALHIRNGGQGAAFGKAAERDQELDIGTWKLTCGGISSHICVELASFSSLPKTVYHPAITANHIVTRDEVGTPSAMTSDWTVTTANGSLTISGSISGSTTLRLILEIPGTTVTG